MLVPKTLQKRILIAEDDEALRTVLKKRFEKEFDVIEAVNGKEALELEKTTHPDVILLDLVMPEKTGYDFLREFAIENNRQTPVIVLSNLDDEREIDRANNLGTRRYLVKSNVNMQTIFETVKEMLSHA